MRGLERARHRAQRSFRRRMGEKETQNPAVIAKVGNGAGTVVVPGRPGWIYVRLHGDDNQLTEAKLGIPLDTGSLDDAWVRVKRASPRKASYYAVQEFITSSTGDPAPPISAHALDPDAGPHTGTLPEDDVAFDDGAGHDHGGAAGTGKKVSHPDLLDVTADLHHSESHAPDHKSGGAQPLDVKELVDSEGRLLTGTQKTDLTDGGTTVLHQHAGGATASVLITLTNQTGGQRAAGDVVVTDPDNDESFEGTVAVGYQGKVLVVGETIADLTGGLCWERGGPFDVKVTGTVSRNDGLRTSATIYRAEAAPSITGGGVFAVALAPNISGEGTVKAVFLDAIGGGGGGGGTTVEIQEDDAKVADADTINFEGGGGKVTDEGGGKVTVDITPGAAGGKEVLLETAQAAANDDHTTLNTWEDIDSMSVTIAPTVSCKLLCEFTCIVLGISFNWEHFEFRFDLDGSTQSETYKKSKDTEPANNEGYIIHIHTVFEGVSSGNRTVKAQWRDGSTNLDARFKTRRLTVMSIED